MSNIKDIVLEYVKDEYLDDPDEELGYDYAFWKQPTKYSFPTTGLHPKPLIP